MIERQIDVETADGACTTFIVHPDRNGPHPVVVFFMDAPGIREELRDMARRLATSGYYVMLPNLYYRAGEFEIGPISREPESPSRLKMQEMMKSIDIPDVMKDFDAMLKIADADDAANADEIGVIGYCMSGRYALASGQREPTRVKATASIYGTELVTDGPDSPHLIGKTAPAEFYFACAETDAYVPMATVHRIQNDLEGANGEIEIYPGTGHGFAFPERPAYNKAAAEQHWERLLALFQRRLS